MPDDRLTDYAKLLAEDCIDVQPGWQVVIAGGFLGRPLLEEIIELDGKVVQQDGTWLI